MEVRRWRISLPPHGLSPPSPCRSPVLGTDRSRFSCLLEDTAEGGASDDDCASQAPFDAALDVLEEVMAPAVGSMEGDGKEVGRLGRKSDDEIAAEFWKEIGYPTP